MAGLSARARRESHRARTLSSGEFDKLWITNEDEVIQFGKAFSGSPSVDARLLASAGHCIDFHRVGVGFQLEQIGFALRCGVVRGR